MSSSWLSAVAGRFLVGGLVCVGLAACGGGKSNASNSSSGSTCGDGTLQTDEECEGFELRDRSCFTEGFRSGGLACTSDCHLDFTGCGLCHSGADCGGVTQECPACLTAVTNSCEGSACAQHNPIAFIVNVSVDVTALQQGSLRSSLVNEGTATRIPGCHGTACAAATTCEQLTQADLHDATLNVMSTTWAPLDVALRPTEFLSFDRNEATQFMVFEAFSGAVGSTSRTAVKCVKMSPGSPTEYSISLP
jgi:hypothetical protein